VPEEGACDGFSLLLLQNTEDYPFILVNGNDTLLAISEPYQEFVGYDLLPDTDDFTHGTAAVTAALTDKGHSKASLNCQLVLWNG
jgi:hypothetical protein